MCKSSSYTENITMFSFTKNKELAKSWLHKIRVDTIKSKRNPIPFLVKSHTKVSLFFCKHLRKGYDLYLS